MSVRMLGVQPANNAATDIVDEEGRCGSVQQVELGVQGGGKTHNDAHADDKGCIAAVNADFMVSSQLEHSLEHLRKTHQQLNGEPKSMFGWACTSGYGIQEMQKM